MSRQHGVVVGTLYYTGFFLLFCCLGTFGSAGFIAYRGANWPVTNAQIQGCSLGKYPLDKQDSLYALHCEINYQHAGRSYKNILQTRLTSSNHERDTISNWIASNRSGTVVIKVNPAYPDEYVVRSPLPGKRGDQADDFANAGIILGCVSFALLAAARALVRRGW